MTEHVVPRVPQGGLSQVRGETDVALSDSTVHGLLAAAARRWPERDAAVFVAQGVRVTWRELLDEAEAVAAGLWALGVRRGDRVGIWSPNRVEWLLTQFATARIGAILVNINPAYRLSELEHCADAVGGRAAGDGGRVQVQQLSRAAAKPGCRTRRRALEAAVAALRGAPGRRGDGGHDELAADGGARPPAGSRPAE